MYIYTTLTTCTDYLLFLRGVYSRVPLKLSRLDPESQRVGDPSEVTHGDGVLTRRFRFFLGFFLPFDAEGVVGVVGGT